jgi:hypothetical protein
MESAKEKAIREAWEQIGLGHLYEKTNEDGWLNCVEGQYNNYDKLDRMRFNSQRHSVRPESLHGTSSNNGWTRIESEADLPNEDGYYEVCKDGVPQKNKSYYHSKFSGFKVSRGSKQITHWKTPIEVNPPIY